MGNIEELVKAAIDEFGELAFERFILIANGFGEQNKNNDTLRHILEYDKYLQNHEIKLKPLPELFAHDVKFYGDNAYLMWSGSVTYDDAFGDFYEVRDVVFDDNAHVLSEFKVSTLDSVYRKTSAARPFDLELAKAGDVVENYHETYKQWQVMSRSCIFEMKKYTNKVSEYYVRVQLCEGASIALKADNLRMKFPKKAQS